MGKDQLKESRATARRDGESIMLIFMMRSKKLQKNNLIIIIGVHLD
jgi:hypothetical protein